MNNRNFAWLAFGAMIITNIFRSGGENSVGSLSDRYYLDVTPAGFTFSIWGLIYTSLAVQIYRGAFDNSIKLFSASCLFNILWLFFWTTPSLSPHLELSFLSLLALSITLLSLWSRVKDDLSASLLSIYVAWVIGATFLNLGVVMRWVAGISDESVSTFIVVMVSLVQAFWQLIVTTMDSKQALRSLGVPLVGIWTGIGIVANGNKFKLSGLPLIVSTIASLYHTRMLYWKKPDNSMTLV